MTHRYIPNLSWNKQNIAYLLLYTVFKHNINNIRTKLANSNISQKTLMKSAKIVKNRSRRIKNNQFNIKWFFNRYLNLYYQANKISHLYNIETRLDLILFRTNWFINKEAVRIAIKSGLIQVNNKVVHGRLLTNGHIHLKPGDVVKLNIKGDLNKLLLISQYESNINSSSNLSLTNWYYDYRYNLIPNIPYIEINNNTKTLVVLHNPKFNQIPYPFNLRKFKS